MNRERFILLVKNPALLKASDAPFLEELLKEFPFFQTAHLLAARCYKVSDSIHLQKQIKSAAAHIIDRKVLYNLIENFPVAESGFETKVIDEAGIENTIIPIVDKQSSQIVEDTEVYSEEQNNSISAVEPSLSNEESSKLSNVALDEEISSSNNLSHEKLSNENGVENDLIDQPDQNEQVEQATEILYQNENLEHILPAVAAEIPLEREIKLALAETIYTQQFEHQIEQKLESDTKSEDFSPEIQKNAIEPEVKTVNEDEKQGPIQNNEQTTEFVTWLKNLQMNADHLSNQMANKPTKVDGNLIDAFMEKPIMRAKPVKQEFYSPVNMAKQSVSDNDFFVTETLAKIYIKQGNLAKAIKVYQNLSLKNPEKNNIFAAQIKILKEQLHNKSGK